MKNNTISEIVATKLAGLLRLDLTLNENAASSIHYYEPTFPISEIESDEN